MGQVCRFGGVNDGTLRVCCSSHNDLLCAHHYARTHFVETMPEYNGPTCTERAATSVDDVVAAARKVCAHPGYYPDHLGDCIGVLSEPSCECGIADLAFAVRRLNVVQGVVQAVVQGVDS